MTVKIITIGNSKGIRIPNNVLKSLEIDSEVDLIVNEDKKELLLRPIRKTRQGWERAFKKMKDHHDDRLLIDDAVDADTHDWEW